MHFHSVFLCFRGKFVMKNAIFSKNKGSAYELPFPLYYSPWTIIVFAIITILPLLKATHHIVTLITKAHWLPVFVFIKVSVSKAVFSMITRR